MSESFAELFEESLTYIEMTPGSLVSATIVDVTPDFVTVSAGLKSEGVIPAEQFKNEAGEITAKVGEPKVIQEEDFAWRDLGVDKDGTTTSLTMETEILRDMNKLIFNQYKSGKIDQHSVGMRYIKLDLAVNDPDEKEEFAVWEKYIGEIANKEKAESQGFFWVVKEAALFEISAVLMGSNPITPTLEPEKSTPDTDEKAADALSESKKLFYKHLI